MFNHLRSLVHIIIAFLLVTKVESAADHYQDGDCADNQGSFRLSNGKWRTCSWAQRNQHITDGVKPCTMGIVKRECPVTCGECKPQEDLVETCADYDDYFQVWVQGEKVWRRCPWVKKDRDRRCRLKVPFEMCPATCGTCPYIPSEPPTVIDETKGVILNCSDSTNEFLIDNEWRTCQWLAAKLILNEIHSELLSVDRNYTKALCEEEAIFRECPMTCGYCNHDPTSSIIRNDMQWYDQNNEPIRAARCGSISTPHIDGYYYFVGSEPSFKWRDGGDIWLYKSSNLGSNSWEHVKTIHVKGVTASCNINKHENGNVFIHCRRQIFVSTNGVEGDYVELPTLTKNIGTENERNRNFGGSSTFVDEGKMYIITSRMNSHTRDRDIFLYRLNDSWTDWHPDERLVATWSGRRRESPDIVKTDSGYYYFASETHGWRDSKTFYRQAESLVGLSTAAEHEVNFLPHNTDTIQSHGSQFCSINRLEENKWIFQGRRHPAEDPTLWDPTYGMFVVAPVKFNDGVPTVYWKHEFDVNTFDYDSDNPSYDSHYHGGFGHAPTR